MDRAHYLLPIGGKGDPSDFPGLGAFKAEVKIGELFPAEVSNKGQTLSPDHIVWNKEDTDTYRTVDSNWGANGFGVVSNSEVSESSPSFRFSESLPVLALHARVIASFSDFKFYPGDLIWIMSESYVEAIKNFNHFKPSSAKNIDLNERLWIPYTDPNFSFNDPVEYEYPRFLGDFSSHKFYIKVGFTSIKAFADLTFSIRRAISSAIVYDNNSYSKTLHSPEEANSFKDLIKFLDNNTPNLRGLAI